jgi:cobalt/nickel transport system permease protein
MRLSLGRPVYQKSLLSSLDARWKLAGIILFASSILFLHNLATAATALFAALLLALLARLPLAWYLRRLAALALFVSLFVIPLPFVTHSEGQTWSMGWISVSPTGLRWALHFYLLLCCKTFAIVSLMFVAWLSAPLSIQLQAAQSLRVPNVLVQLLLVSYRYSLVLWSELKAMRIALRVRGYRNRASRHGYRTTGQVIGTLLVRGYERGERVGQAMRCRGFDGTFRTLSSFNTSLIDIVFFLLLTGSAGSLLFWDRFLG